jgi:hypothetical protein
MPPDDNESVIELDAEGIDLQAKFNAALAKPAANGTLTPQQTARVTEEWKKRRISG